ncbi:MAG: AAA family ATPase [Chloroflexi bacterium]|nr:AAA family ATPase [Chloroflexota bacterium]OJW05335.1 MAG: kinase [Chloroflexi bacterium 54-19]
MQAIIFVGIQGAGKSTFFKEKFFNTHIRINMDMLKTRHREDLLLAACLEMKQPFVIDKTNPTVQNRERYIQAAKEHRFQVVAYYFVPDLKLSLARNAARTSKERVPDMGLYATLKKLQPPTLEEGFDLLYTVRQDEAGNFVVEPTTLI